MKKPDSMKAIVEDLAKWECLGFPNDCDSPKIDKKRYPGECPVCRARAILKRKKVKP